MLSPVSFCPVSSPFARVVKKATLLDGAFKFQDQKKVDAILAKYPKDQKRAATIPLLHLAQSENGWLSRGAIEEVANVAGTTIGRVHETASFYTMFRFAPPQKHIIEICRGLVCYMKGSDHLQQLIEKETKGSFKTGKSPDGKFQLQTTECLGACVNAPVMIVDGVYYQDLTDKKVKEIIRNIKKGKSIEKLSAQNTPVAKPVGK